MNLALPCGREMVEALLPDRALVLETRGAPPLADPGSAVAAALTRPVGSPSLQDLARGRTSACVVISDITRPVPNRILLPPLLETLEGAGIPRPAITILVATGMHRPSEASELVELVGRATRHRYRVLDHDCHDRGNLVPVGSIEGVPIEINRHYLQADLKILTGLIEPHPYAGFSGGGKSILPGLSGFETMKFMHSCRLVDHPDVATARLDGNPFRRYIDQVSGLAGADFIVNVTINRDKAVTGVFAGDVRLAHLEGCRFAAESSLVCVPEPADLVITSSAGYPLDATFYQATKAIHLARELLTPGGTILWIAGCEEGLGSEGFRKVAGTVSSLSEFRVRYGHPDRFVIDQWSVQCALQTLQHAGQVLLFSPNLTASQLPPWGVEKVTDLNAAIAEASARSSRIFVIPEGPYLAGSIGRPLEDRPRCGPLIAVH